MVAEWPVKQISECAADEPYSTQIGPFGKALMADEYRESGVPVLRGVNVNRGRFHDDDFVFIAAEAADRLSKFESFPGDVLLVHKGTLGQISLMPSRRKYDRYIMGNSMLRVRCDPSKLLPEFLYYWLSSTEGQSYLFSRVSQVGVPQIHRPLTTLREARLAVPSIAEQRSIVAILGALDEKIELDQRMNETLFAVAQAIFNAWFIDFEPSRAKSRGATSFRGMPPAVFEQLPSRLVDSQLGLVPSDWKVVPFLDLVELIGGGTPRRKVPEFWDGEIPWYSIRDAPASRELWVIDTEEQITEEGIQNSAAKVMRSGTTIISARGTVGRLALTAVPMAMNQSCYGVQGMRGVGDFFVYFTLRHAVAELQRRTHGSVFDTITRKTFEALAQVRPQPQVLEAFEEAVAPYLLLMRANRVEIKTLSALRDALLPKLIFGEIRVPGAEKVDHGGSSR